MSKAHVGAAASPEFLEAAGLNPKPPVDAPVTKSPEESFNYTLPNGDVIVTGHTRGVIKLKLRDILTDGQFKDAEIKEIGKAFLSIRSAGGVPLFMRTPEHFEAMLNRFGSDENLDAYMNEWQKFANPVVHGIITKAFQEALDKGLMGEAIEHYVNDAVMAEAQKNLEKVKI
jgi:hypothetical protein